ncbi:MAG: hypothetical protein ACI4KA_09380 [Oscillospiraceae bacterium]
MKKPRRIIAAAAFFAAVLNINGCGVYGPPEEENHPFDPGANYEQNVYGPPPSQYITDGTDETSETAEQTEEFKPELNEQPGVYGPPRT